MLLAGRPDWLVGGINLAQGTVPVRPIGDIGSRLGQHEEGGGNFPSASI